MNDSMILIARLRRGEMIREARQGKLAAAAARLGRQQRGHRQQRAAQASGGPVPRPAMTAARMRPTVTGR
jgi:hypothetical protein